MVSNKKIGAPRKRTYVLKARARRQEEIHRRITEAAVHLHGTVGPMRTTMGDIAELAGVRRATVYNHFPTESDLFDACSSHWFADNPPPDPAPWTEIDDPRLRAEAALTAMFAYYENGREMLANVLRDAPLKPALGEILEEKWRPLMEGIVDVLAAGWASGRNDADLRATLAVALDFFTWHTLDDSGLTSADAARLATRWIASLDAEDRR